MEEISNFDHDFEKDEKIGEEALEGQHSGDLLLFNQQVINSYLKQDIEIHKKMLQKSNEIRPVREELRKTKEALLEQMKKASQSGLELMRAHLVEEMSDEEFEQGLIGCGEYEYLAIWKKEKELELQLDKYKHERGALERLSKKSEERLVKLLNVSKGENPYGDGDINDN